MRSFRLITSALFILTLAALGTETRAQDKKKVDPKAAEVEKLLLAVPEEVTQGEWIKAWREKLVISFSDEMVSGARGQIYSGDIVKFSLENKTPCTIKVRSDLPNSTSAGRLAGLNIDGQPTKKIDPKAKDEKPAAESWTVEPGKKLALSRKPKVPKMVLVVPLKNDLEKKALVSSITTGPFCTIEVVPTDKDAKPLELVMLTKVGMNGIKIAVSGFYLCKPDDMKSLSEKISKFN